VLNRAKADIERSIANVESMLNDIMDFSREVRLETKPCFLNAVFDYSIRQTAQIYPHTDVNFSYDVCHTYKPFADDERFARVCTNVILNAIEAVTIMDKKVKGSIYISSKDLIKNDKRFVEIIIANNGPKFRQEDLVNLFTPFFTKGKKEGTGLGLASAYKIVNLHEGTITARNMDVNKAMELGWDRDEGVEFIIDIPASDEHDKIKTDILPKNIKEVALVESKRDRDKIDTIIDKLYQKQKQFKVLLLEDEALYRASVKNTVRKNENLTKMLVLYDVSTVEEALELIKQEDITHAIVDIDLGQARNGFDFIKEIKDKHPQILCMVHSNRHLEKDRIRAKKLGVKAYVPKPLSIEHLVLFLSE
jgi:CheY-like chemotaxis protein